MFQKLLTELQSSKIIQKYDWEESIPTDIWEKYDFLKNIKVVAENLDIEEHRWYDVSTTVISTHGGFIGIRHISKLNSESSSYEDCYRTMEFFEMEEVQITSYKRK